MSNRRAKGSRSLGGFWSNFFRASIGSSSDSTTEPEPVTGLSMVVRSTPPVSRRSSLDSLNTIQSTHSFAFVSPKAYVGRGERRRGRRIPVEADDSHFRQEPQKPQLKSKQKKHDDGTLCFALKSKYNLQSCESLAIGTFTRPDRVDLDQQAKPGPSSRGHRLVTPSPSCQRRRSPRSKLPSHQNLSRKHHVAEKGQVPLDASKQENIAASIQKKRRAPLPPSVKPVQTNTYDARREQSNHPEVDTSQRHRRCQSDTTGCERSRPKAHVAGKRRAPPTPTQAGILTESKHLGNQSEMFGKKEMPISNRPPLGPGLDVKPLPRPWYKRRSSGSSKSPAKSPNPKPIINLPNLSKLDQEAAQIIEENNRRSAEVSHNQTAKELINMFNSTFNTSKGVVSENESAGSKFKIQTTPNSAKSTPKPISQIDVIKNSNGKEPEVEDRKKLAIVQPQKSNSTSASVKANSQLGASAQTTSPNTPRNSTSAQNGLRTFIALQNGTTPEFWACPRCTLNNSGWRAFCDVCFFRKDSVIVSTVQTQVTVQSSQPAAQPSGNVQNSTNVVATDSFVAPTADSGVVRMRAAPHDDVTSQSNFPSCQNFLSQLPSKQSLPKEKVGLKLLEDKSESDLNIEALREARVAFFTKAVSSPDSNNFENGTDFKELNFPPESVDRDLELVELLLQMNRNLSDPNLLQNGRGSKKFQMLHDAMFENCQSANFEKLYKSWNDWLTKVVEPVEATNTIMQRDIQLTIKEQLNFYKQKMEEEAREKSNSAALVEACRKQGAIPKYLLQEAEQTETNGRSHKQNHVQTASDLLRRIDWAISHGEFRLAAKLAYELAAQDLETPKRTADVVKQITIRVYVEDRMMQQGPFAISVKDSMTVGELKLKIEFDWSIPANFQKWILGKRMAESDDDRLSVFKVQDESLAFLYLVTPEFGPREGSKTENSKQQPLHKVNNTQNMPNLGKLEINSMDLEASGKKSNELLPKKATKIIAVENFEPTLAENNKNQVTATMNGNLKENFEMKKEINETKVRGSFSKQNSEPSQIQNEPPDISNTIAETISISKTELQVSKLNITTTPKVFKSEYKLSKVEKGNSESDINSNISNPNATHEVNFKIINAVDTLSAINPLVSKTGDANYTESTKENTKVISNISSSAAAATATNNASEVPAQITKNDHSHLQQKKVETPKPDLSSPTVTKLDSRLSNNNPPRLFGRRASLEQHNPRSVVQPFTRRLSGSLTKQIQMFEALNASSKSVPTHAQKNDLVSVSSKSPQVPTNSSHNNAQVLGATAKQELADNYQKLLELEKSDVIRSEVVIECPICFSTVDPGQGVVLRECLHSFCVECVAGVIEFAEGAQVKCPYRDQNYACDGIIQEREIKALVSTKVFNNLLAKSVKLAECKMSNAFHCKTTDCPGWCVFEDTVNVFHCPVCSKSNCLNCRAIHEKLDCQQYQRQLAIASETDEDAKSSRIMLEKMIERGEALDCPACHVVLLKKWGCDWVRCSYCKTEICWVTKSFRWGPNGKGDISGGCKCGVNGVKCHPKCTYCH